MWARHAGLPVTYRFDPTTILLAALAALILTALASAGPARQTARLSIIETIGYE